MRNLDSDQNAQVGAAHGDPVLAPFASRTRGGRIGGVLSLHGFAGVRVCGVLICARCAHIGAISAVDRRVGVCDVDGLLGRERDTADLGKRVVDVCGGGCKGWRWWVYYNE